MTNPNLARNLLIASGAAIACLGLTACSGHATAESTTPPATTQPSPEIQTDDDRQIVVKQTYMPNGTRLTSYSNKYGIESNFPTILAHCDGGSMVEVTGTGYNWGGGAVTRTPDTSMFHPCDDGRLDPKDFE
jgi:hypothetical protein